MPDESTLSRRQRWRQFKNFMHNELSVSKEDILGWVREAVSENVILKHVGIALAKDFEISRKGEAADVDSIKLSSLVRAWELLHVRELGSLGFCDLENDLEQSGVKIVNDINTQQPVGG